jgi:DNA polymerase-3 subunit gamma/tau
LVGFLSVTAPAALYRRYRPDTFQDVIGQEHVTEPLMTALRKNRVNHAYLFSGPRGCGKTTSARILARCLNCEQGPTPEPCGVCPSCVELARGGAGSLDVIEIDAASHGGVDDARDLRERATFAPVRDRYKIFIIDEAHMVTSAGFNALLKIVEEPPEHIKFIFATTEPDKVIGTIRSRTHHYPFRLVPPEPLMAYLEQLCASEHVPVAPGVLSLVVRAGGGSVRDSLSVLDQLMAGAGSEGLDYELAVALLGYTHATLLDDVVDAMAAGDSGTVFRAVDRVIQTGHDPRRFVEDLLERFRDLIIVQAVPDAAEAILRGVPADQLSRMRVQAQNLGAAELSRAADVTNEAFNEMTGATSPRLHLELLCARLMLPAADAGERGWAARVDRLERRLAFAHDGAGAPAAAGAPGADDTAPQAAERSAPSPAAARDAAPTAPERTAPSRAAGRKTPPPAMERSPGSGPAEGDAASSAAEGTAPSPAVERSTPAPAVERTAASPIAGRNAPSPGPERRPSAPTSAPDPTSGSGREPARAASPAQAPAQTGGAGSVEMFRRAWPEILDTLAKVKRSTWALVGPNASVSGFDGRTLALAFGTSGLAAAFTRGDHAQNLHTAIQTVLGVDCQIDAVTGGNGPGVAPTAAAPMAGGDQRPKAPAEPHPGTPAPAAAPPAANRTAVPENREASALPPSQPLSPSSSRAAAPAPEARQAPSAADVAWGLAPAATASPAAAAPAPAATPVPPAPPATAAPPAHEADAPQRDEREPSPAAQSPASTTQASTPEAGPDGRRPSAHAENAVSAATLGVQAPSPYDGIPYADEEPPGEWDEPYPEDAGYSRGAPDRREASVPQTPSAPEPKAPESDVRDRAGARDRSDVSDRPGVRDRAGTTASGAHPGTAPADDPWSYARESTPGVWSIGTETNVRAAGGSVPSGAPTQPGVGEAEEREPAAAPPSYEPAAAQHPAPAPSDRTSAIPSGPQRPQDPGRKLSMYERLSQKAAAERSQAQHPSSQGGRDRAPESYVEDVPSADDETIENSALFGRAAVERILGGRLVEERGLDGTVIPPR